jgi:hypothetical protein
MILSPNFIKSKLSDFLNFYIYYAILTAQKVIKIAVVSIQKTKYEESLLTIILIQSLLNSL